MPMALKKDHPLLLGKYINLNASRIRLERYLDFFTKTMQRLG